MCITSNEFAGDITLQDINAPAIDEMKTLNILPL